MAAITIPALSLPAPTSFPVAGVNGEFYDVAFGVPTYSVEAFNVISWRSIDNWDHANSNYVSSEGIAVGLIWATLIYLLALTPNRKKTTPFHTSLLLGLVFMLLHLMMEIIAALTPELHITSAYTVLTGDITSSTWPTRYKEVYATSRVAAWLAFIFAAICLWLQARGLMTGIRVRLPILYRVILSYLVITALAALGACMAYWIQQIMIISEAETQAMSNYSAKLRDVYLITYAISIGSFSLVSICSVMDIVWKRPSSVIKGHNVFASALNLVGLLCAQSFIVPLIFCILQILPSQSQMALPEIMLLPSVYLILPLGSLFMTVNSNDTESQKALSPSKTLSSPMGLRFDRSPTLTSGTLQGSRRTSSVLDSTTDEKQDRAVFSPVDRELNLIDSLDHVINCAETESMLHEKIEASRPVTPGGQDQSSQPVGNCNAKEPAFDSSARYFI